MLRVTTQMTGVAGAPYYSTMYFQGTELAQAQNAADRVRTFWDSLKGLITAGLSISVVLEVEEVNPTTGLIENVYPVTGTPVASTGNAPLPKSTQGLLRLRTNTFVAGRRLQGRVFIPALANDAQLGGVPSSALILALENAGDELIGDPGGLNVLGVFSRKNLEFAPVTSVSAWTQFAVLRSRRD